jgi:hypothetical protein
MTARTLRRAGVAAVTGVLAAILGAAPACAFSSLPGGGDQGAAASGAAGDVSRVAAGITRGALSSAADALSGVQGTTTNASTVPGMGGAPGGPTSGAGAGGASGASPGDIGGTTANDVAHAALDLTRGALSSAADALSGATGSGPGNGSGTGGGSSPTPGGGGFPG